MTRIVVQELEWNAHNRQHIRKHGVTELEVEIAGYKQIYHKRTYKGRYLLIGRSEKRLIAVVIRRLGPKRYHVVTARDASKKERRRVYEKEKKQNS